MTEAPPRHGIRFVSRLPTPAEHRALAESVGWGDHFDEASLPGSLDGSLTGVVALDGERAAAMGRLVGDGCHYFYVQDVIVDPVYQDEGLGSGILQRLLRWIEDTAPAEAFVGLFSSPAGEALYAEHGFATVDMLGMHRTVQPATLRS